MEQREIGRKIREIRKRQHLSQANVAERAGIKQATVSLVEIGKRDYYRWSTLEAIAKALGVKLVVKIEEV